MELDEQRHYFKPYVVLCVSFHKMFRSGQGQ